MAAVRGSLRLDGALAGWSPRPTLARAHRSYAAIVPPRGTPTRAPFVLQPVSRGPSAASRTPQRHWWRTSAAASNDLEEGGGNGDSGGGDGGGAGGSGGSSGDSSNEGEDNNPGLSGNMWMLAGAAATVLAIFLVRQKLRQQERPQRSQSRGATPAASSQQPSSDELAALTRLTQEAFAELVKVKERLDELEEDAGIGPGSAQAGTSALSAGGGGMGGIRGRPGAGGGTQQQQQQHPHGRHRLAGVLRLGGGLLWAQEGGGGAAGTLRAAGLRLGTDALLQLAAVVRGGRDSVHAEYRLDAAAERASLRKVLYNCRLGSRLRLVLAPFGARGRDAAYTLNPLAGQGLSGMVRDGSPLHQPVLGSLAGVAVEAPRAWFSAGYFAKALPSGGATASLLAQAVVAPTNSLSVGLTLLEQRSQAAPAAAAVPGGLASAGGRLSGSGSGVALAGLLGRAAAAAADALGVSAACEARQLGAMLAWRLGQDAVVHAWAAADGAEVERRVRAGELGAAARPREWGLVLGSYPDGTGNGWALGVGRSATAAAAAAGGGAGTASSSAGGPPAVLPNLFELSLQWNLGEGLLLSPGLLLLSRGGGKDPIAFMGLRSTWAF